MKLGMYMHCKHVNLGRMCTESTCLRYASNKTHFESSRLLHVQHPTQI